MTHFLQPAPDTPEARVLIEGDTAELGFVMNATRLWAADPELKTGLFDLLGATVARHGLTFRQRAIMVAACASAMGDAYCSLAWGGKLAKATDPVLAGGVIRGDDAALADAERTLATWTRTVARDPNATTAADVEALRAAGFTDDQIFACTVFIALRIAFSTVNDALGAQPDAELVAGLPDEVRTAVDFGRPVAERR